MSTCFQTSYVCIMYKYFLKTSTQYITFALTLNITNICVFCQCLLLTELTGRVNRLGRSYVTQGDRKIRDLHPFPPDTVVQLRLMYFPTFSQLHLFRAGIISYWGARRTQPIRMEETYTPTTMKPAGTVICD
jgi:hypothetical protein